MVCKTRKPLNKTIKMKKGQTESYSFLIGIIITVLILTGVGCAVYQIYRPQTSESFERLADLLETLEKENEDAAGEIPIYVDKNKVVIGFNKGMEEIQKPAWQWEKGCYGLNFNTELWSIFGVEAGINYGKKEKLQEIYRK